MATTPASIRSDPTRAGATTVALVLGGYLLAVFLLLLYLNHQPKPGGLGESPKPTTSAASYPSPPPGAVVFSREAGDAALALAVLPQKDDLLVQASVVGPDGVGVSGLATTFVAGGATAAGAACGSGCYRTTLTARGRPRAVELVVDGGIATHWRVPLPAAWPPRDASTLIAGATRAWRSLRSLSFRERLASDAEHAVTSTWRVQAPDRLAYEIDRGPSAVIIGKRRWDKAPGGVWNSSPQFPVNQPTPLWVSATNAFVIARTTARGRPAWKASFFDPKTPAWFTVVLDRRTLRTLDLRMVATAHFMHDVYGAFDATPAIRMPRGG
jgi:hypothetical protein